jgi:hypothetical protein
MIQKCELTGLVGRLERDLAQAEGLDEAIGECAVEIALGVEQPDSSGGLPRLHHELDGACVQPSASLVDQFADDTPFKSAAVFFAQFELDLQAPLPSHRHHFGGRHGHVREALARFNSGDAEVGAKVQVGR